MISGYSSMITGFFENEKPLILSDGLNSDNLSILALKRDSTSLACLVCLECKLMVGLWILY